VRRLLVVLVVLLPFSFAMAGCGTSGNSGDSGKAADISKDKMEQMTKQRLADMQKAMKKGGSPAEKAATPPADTAEKK